jgi:hypothetical protein
MPIVPAAATEDFVGVDAIHRRLQTFNRVMVGVLAAFVVLLFVALALRDGDGKKWGLLIVASAGAAGGGALALWLSTLQQEGARFREALTALSSAVGGTALFDLGNDKGVLRTAIQSLAVGCGMNPGDSLVVMTFLGFAGVSMLWLYLNRVAWLNSLIARGARDAKTFDASDTTRPPAATAALPGIGGTAPVERKDAPAGGASTATGPAAPGKPTGEKATPMKPEVASPTFAPAGVPVHLLSLETVHGASTLGHQPASNEASADPLHAEYAGHEQAAGFRISARVRETDDPEWFEVYAIVRADEPEESAGGSVLFLLHPSFQPKRIRRSVVGGFASIRLTSWGAFTLGAHVTLGDGRTIKLGIDLAMLPDAPSLFKLR